jgi:hypothetical protein
MTKLTRFRDLSKGQYRAPSELVGGVSALASLYKYKVAEMYGLEGIRAWAVVQARSGCKALG